MRVLFVSHDFLPRHSAGTEVYTWQLARRLSERGHDVHVFTTEKDVSRADGSLVRRSFDGIPVHELTNNLFYEDFRETYDWPPAARTFSALLDELRPDVVHFMHLLYLSVECVELAASRGVPLVFTLHDYWLQCARFGQRIHADGTVCHEIDFARCGTCLARTKLAQTPLERRTARALAALRRASGLDLTRAARGAAGLFSASRKGAPAEPPLEREEELAVAMARREEELRERLLPAVDRFLAPSRFLFDAFEAWGVPSGRLEHVPYGIDLEPFEGLERRPGDTLRVRFLGTLAPHKAPHVLLEAWDLLPAGLRAEASLSLHGSRAHFPSYVARCEALEAQVGAAEGGEVSREGVPGLLAATDVLVVPSIWYENSPLVIHEALAARTPLVVSDLGGMAELVTPDHDGWRFAAGDARDLARVLRAVLSDPERLAALPFDATRPKDMRVAAADMEQTYEALVARRGGGS